MFWPVNKNFLELELTIYYRLLIPGIFLVFKNVWQSRLSFETQLKIASSLYRFLVTEKPWKKPCFCFFVVKMYLKCSEDSMRNMTVPANRKSTHFLCFKEPYWEWYWWWLELAGNHMGKKRKKIRFWPLSVLDPSDLCPQIIRKFLTPKLHEQMCQAPPCQNINININIYIYIYCFEKILLWG